MTGERNVPGEDGEALDVFDPARYMQPPRSGWFRSLPPVDASEADRVYARQPNMGYALLALGIGLVCLLVATMTVLGVGRRLHLIAPLASLKSYEIPKASILAETLGYGLALAILVPLLRGMWRRPFAEVLRMRWPVARRSLGWLLLLGIGVSVAAQAAESLLTLPKEVPMDAFFRTPADVWCVALFGTLVAPAIEELLFRGFLLPAFAIAFDWLRLPRTPEAREHWRSTDGLSRGALVFSAATTSVLFGAMHAAQLSFAWNAVALLSVVGGALALVRLWFDSVWASAVVHMAYNGFIFGVLFFATGGFVHLDRLHGH